MKRVALALMLFSLITLSGCMLVDKNIVEGTGTMKYLDFEGGFYGIVADDGQHYDLLNLPSEFEEDGLRVSFRGKIRNDLASFHMWGNIIKLIYIKKL